MFSSRLIFVALLTTALQPSECDRDLNLYISRNARFGKSTDGSAVSGATSSLPVIIWFYGGAYLFGSKDAGAAKNLPLYDGRGLVEAGQNMTQDIIFVAGNYRLAHLGWLAGPTFGDNPGQVTAMSESAGAGSILHHLVAKDSNNEPRDPLFQKAILQSAAFQWIWNNTEGGTTDKIFQNFAGNMTACKSLVGSAALDCLQSPKVSSSDISVALAMASYWKEKKCSGVWNLGPVVDGKTIEQLPGQSLEAPGFQFHKNVEAIISSHVDDEANIFVPKFATNKDGFSRLLESFLPGESSARQQQRQCITQHYCPGTCKSGQIKSAELTMQDSMFTCNVRYSFDAVRAQKPSATPIYIMGYALCAKVDGFFNPLLTISLALHGSDLIPTFWNTGVNTTAMKSVICGQAKGVKECAAFVKNLYIPNVQRCTWPTRGTSSASPSRATPTS
ncbi:Alpha/Beta hydrolase protein [Podospora didyma]|uniref:Alpha/Beta hydrolase protein n=1 Tax=Podospora didyma TaxID=330526 RepID=A0AAE0P544_9PEZI|nr:Alpha/Beta hydrolase protein [Podospora didyma]